MAKTRFDFDYTNDNDGEVSPVTGWLLVLAFSLMAVSCLFV